MRAYPLLTALGIGALLVSCDKKAADAPPPSPQPKRVTKSLRPAPIKPENPQERGKSAIREASEISSPEERTKALAAAIWDAAEEFPEEARDGLQKLPTGSQTKNDLIQHLAMRLAETNADEAKEWAASLETIEEKSMAFAKIALVLSQTDPAQAAHLLSESGVAGREFDVALVQVVQRWADKAPADALAWVTLFPPGEARTASMTEAISSWSNTDPQAAAAWVTNHVDPVVRQEGQTAIARSILDLPETNQPALLQQMSPEVRAEFKKLKAERQEEATREDSDR